MTDILRGGLVGSPLYIIRGGNFLYNNKVLWKYAAAPIAIGFVILGGSYALLYYFFLRMYNAYFNDAGLGLALFYILLALLTVMLLVVFFFIFTRVVSAIAAPFNEFLSQKTEELVTGAYVDAPFSLGLMLKDSARAIAHSFKVLGLYLGLLLALLLLFIIPGFGQVVFTIFSAFLSSLMFSYEYLSYPMDRRRFSWDRKKAFLKSNGRSTMSFGLGCLGMAAIPLLNILFVPVAVVGGTLLFLDLNRAQK